MKERDHRLDDYFERYGEMTFRNLLTFVDYHTAEDICQETFLRLSRNLDHVAPEMVKAWLTEVSRRLAIDALRKGGKYTTKFGLDTGSIHIVDARADTERIVEAVEESRKMGRILEYLRQEKPLWYDALLMRYQERMSDREIGKIMGIKASLVGQWRHRARLWLRERYAREYDEDK